MGRWAAGAGRLARIAAALWALAGPAAGDGHGWPAPVIPLVDPAHPFSYGLDPALFAPGAPGGGTGETIGLALGGAGGEIRDIATFPVRAPEAFAPYALGVGALVLLDRPLTIFWQDRVEPVFAGYDLPRLARLRHLSNDELILAAIMAGSWSYGVASGDERAEVAALLTAKTVAYSYVTSHVLLKAGFGRLRPVDGLSRHGGPTGPFTTDPLDFGAGTGLHLGSVRRGTAMPSFHYTMYFAAARVYSGVYDNSPWPYVVAAALALDGIEAHNHWVSDMVAGALIGTGIGNTVLKGYAERRARPTARLVPMAAGGGLGVGVRVSF